MENGKPIIFTRHASVRLRERGITEEQVIKTVKNGKPIGYRDDKRIFERYSTVVVVEDKPDVITVVTVYKSSKTFEQKINAIPQPLEWWKQASKQDFTNQGYILLDKGFSEDEALQILTTLFKAVCGEFGQ